MNFFFFVIFNFLEGSIYRVLFFLFLDELFMTVTFEPIIRFRKTFLYFTAYHGNDFTILNLLIEIFVLPQKFKFTNILFFL